MTFLHIRNLIHTLLCFLIAGALTAYIVSFIA